MSVIWILTPVALQAIGQRFEPSTAHNKIRELGEILTPFLFGSKWRKAVFPLIFGAKLAQNSRPIHCQIFQNRLKIRS